MSAVEKEEDLDQNPFYLLLQSKYSLLYNEAQDNCYTICIPEATSLHGTVLNKQFVDAHILKASPFFEGQYLTTGKNPKTLSLENGLINFESAMDGGPYSSDVRVVSEELGYNKELQQFKILIIDNPLFGKNSKGSHEDAYKGNKIKTSFLENKDFLLTLPNSRSFLPKLNDRINTFQSSYMVLSNYLDDCARKVQNIVSQGKQEALKVHHQTCSQDRLFQEALHIAVESYVLGNLHTKIYGAICEKCSSDDANMYDKCQTLDGLTGDQLELRDEFVCPLPAAVVELASLDMLITPFEKLVCLKNTLGKITEDVNTNIEESAAIGQLCETPCLTSDDLIPLLVTVIVQAKQQHLCSSIMLIDNFNWTSTLKDDLSFSFVTFKAAVEYMKSNSFSDLKPAKVHNRKEIPIEELVETCQLNNGDDSVRTEGELSRARSLTSPAATRTERQLAKISKLLEATEELSLGAGYTPLIGQRRHSSNIPDVIPVQDRPRPNLGSFLTSLQGSTLGSSHGRKD